MWPRLKFVDKNSFQEVFTDVYNGNLIDVHIICRVENEKTEDAGLKLISLRMLEQIDAQERNHRPKLLCHWYRVWKDIHGIWDHRSPKLLVRI